MNKKLKILFFTPHGGYTGSEMMLWYLISNLSKDKFDIFLFSSNKGELLEKFPEHVRVAHTTWTENIFTRALNKLLVKIGKPGLESRQILEIHKTFAPDVWYINTMIMNRVVNLAIKNNIKYFVHFHELMLEYKSISSDVLSETIANATIAVGCSQQVCDNLKILGAKKIVKQYECVDFARIKFNTNTKELKIKHGISMDTTVIVMSGQRIDRKGYDIFVDAAIRNQKSNLHFLWLGSSKNSGYEFFITRLINEKQTSNITIIAPEQNLYYDYLNLADIFFLSSREDPFPLVMLEAAYMKKPILAFHSGGSSEFVNEDVGVVIKSFSNEDIDVGLAEIINLKNKNAFNEEIIQQRAKNFDAKIQAAYFETWLVENLN